MDPTHVPTLILHAPDEEGVEACLSYAGPERLCGLPNSGRSRSVGLVNALVQILGATEEVTQQLPVVANNKHTRDFADTVRQMHRLSRDPTPPCESLLLDSSLDWLVQRLAQVQNATLAAHEPDTVDHIAQIYAHAPKILLDQLKDCRFGNAFKGAFERDKDEIVDSGLDLAKNMGACLSYSSKSSQISSLDSFSTSASDDGSSFTLKTRMTVDIDLQIYAEQDSMDLLTLLRNHFGMKPQPAFFFGFSSSPNPIRHAPPVRTITSPDLDAALLPQSNTATIASPINVNPPKRYTSLPHFFFIILNRPVSTANRSTMHRTSVEMPLDLDFGFLLTPEAYKANAAANKHARQNTLYKLHGFVTQTEGRFLAYTRLRGAAGGGGGGGSEGSISGDWYKAEDEVVSTSPVDLGNRVNSKGVVFMLYCVQNARK
ncbi:hypothetical protein HDU81_002099 [Chytriomyces hyalinus]|nr:hypothetical protein HDU81_002099 [Chytriomyces hyalinus]